MTYTSTQSLIITIIVLLILAGASISMLAGDNGILTRSSEAKVQTAIASKKEEVIFAINEELIANNGDINKVTIENVLNKIKKNYSKSSEKNKITADLLGEDEEKFPAEIIYSPPASTISESIVIKVNKDLSIASSIAEERDAPLPKVKPQEASYQKVGNIYVNSPDLSGFNPEHTYYVTYDSTGNNEKIAGRLDRISANGNLVGEDTNNVWYDYQNKIWANVVTVNGAEVTYWTWIPRYKYKVNANNTIELKYVDKDNKCTIRENEQGKPYDVTDYELSEAFQFDTTKIYGYWISKYEVQESTSLEIATGYSEDKKSITVSSTNPSGKYQIFVDGVEKEKSVTLPYKITKLKQGKEYDICIVSVDNKRMVGQTNLTPYPIEVDASGFNPEHTYYVVYDEDGTNERIAGKIELDENGNIKPPKEGTWYDYSKKIWANIVTVNVSDVAYWTYIPRYEYRTCYQNKNIDIRYIPVSKTTPTLGCTISDAFKFGEKDLKGYWISKYEVQEATSLEKIEAFVDGGTVRVTSSSPSGKYTIYLNNKEYKKNADLPYPVDVGNNKDYSILLVSETNKRVVGETTGKTGYNIEVDLSGFNPNNTFYVLYDEDGTNERIGGKIQKDSNGNGIKPQSGTWYDYEKKIWANIVTINNNQTAYWTYIPRYEYKEFQYNKNVSLKYIPSSQTIADFGYKISEAFTFDNKNLKGYWISKYEVQD